MLEELLAVAARHWPTFLVLVVIVHLARNYFFNGLQKYPGPFAARLSNWWRFFDVLGRRPDITHLKLHRQYGDVVRLGPGVLSFSSPAAVKQIYGLNKGMVKSGFYPVQQAVSNGRRLPSLFSTTDESYHAQLRRSVNSAFSMSALVQYEPLVNEVVDLFLSQTDKLYASTGNICNFATWLQYFAFDVIGKITYSDAHGFVEKNEDIEGIVSYLAKLFGYVAPIGQQPWVDLLFLKNPLVLWLDKIGVKLTAFPIATFAKNRMSERLREVEGNEKMGMEGSKGRADLLSMFLKAKKDRPEFFTDERVLTMAVSMTFAGSETTAISLSAVFYYLLRNRRCYEKVMRELDEAVADGRIEDRANMSVSWSESQKLPYLDACIKEAFRVHPAAGLPLERIVPKQGMDIDGHFVKGGTIVGVSAWVLHKRPEIFDPQHRYNVDDYVPERWLEADKEQLKTMDGNMFQFGAGSRTVSDTPHR